MNRRFIVVGLLLVAAWAAQAEHVGGEATTVPQSECYTCHDEGGGGLGPPLRDMFRVTPDPLTLSVGEIGQLDVVVRNWWVSELSEFVGRIDLSEAPALSFADVPEPLMDQTKQGELPFVATQIGNQERSTRQTISVPLGGTDLQIRVTPERESGAQAPDLELRVWPPGRSVSGDTPIATDSNGAGEMEFRDFTGSPIPEGAWTIEIAQAGALSSPDQSQVVSQPYTISWDLLFEYDDPIRYTSSDEVLDGQELETKQWTKLSWNVRLDEPITAQQRIGIHTEAASFYAHGSQFGAVDEWLFYVDSEIILDPPTNPTDNGTDPVQIGGGGEDEGPDLTDSGSTPAAVWGEIIGYMAAFLLILSIISGGSFGQWSRKLQHWVLFKKAKRRVAFHNLTSYALIVAALVHLVIFLVESTYPWSLGMLLGGASLLGMILAGVTGAFQQAMIRSMGFETWRVLHWLTFALSIIGAVAHMVLDGVHFTDFQEAMGWEDPARPWLDSLF